jgi:hypothetical protein
MMFPNKEFLEEMEILSDLLFKDSCLREKE